MLTKSARPAVIVVSVALNFFALLGSLSSALAADAPKVAAAPPVATAPQNSVPSDTVPPPKDVADLRSLEAKVQAVVAKVVVATVCIDMGGSQGSGVIVSKDGIVMTAGHVVGKPGQKVTFRFADGKTANGITLGLNASVDSGLMRITDKGDWPFVAKGVSSNLKVGSWCVTVGHPLGYHPGRPPVVRIGRVLRNEMNVLQTDSPIVSGDSGGPVFDLDAKVIGINSRIGGGIDQNLHVPSDVFTRDWQTLLTGEVHRGPPAGRDADGVKTAFKSVVAEADHCVVRVQCGGRDAALGPSVGPDGWILTKASELHDKITCQLPDKRSLEARIVGVNPIYDLAMLKVDASGLPSASWITHDPDGGASWSLRGRAGRRPVGTWASSKWCRDAPYRTRPASSVRKCPMPKKMAGPRSTRLSNRGLANGQA